MHAKRAIAAAAVAAAAHGATAFTTSMGMLHAASLRPSVCVPRHARGLALCMTEKQFAVEVDPAELQELLDEAARRYEDGMNPADAKKVLGEGKSVQEALDMLDIAYARREAMGSVGSFFKSFVDVKGEYTDDGWVDEKAADQSQNGFLGGLFGSKTVKRDGSVVNGVYKTRDQLDAEMNVIEFVDGSKGDLATATRAGTAVPFGGLNPNQVEVWKDQEKTEAGTVTKVRSYSRGGPPVPKIPDRYINFPDSPDPRGPPPPPPLPAGWYAATDEATGKEYFYTAQGDVQWDRPLK